MGDFLIRRRAFLGSLIAAPAVIRTPGLLMAIRPVAEVTTCIVTEINLLPYTGATLTEASLLEFDRILRLSWDSFGLHPEPSAITVSKDVMSDFKRAGLVQ